MKHQLNLSDGRSGTIGDGRNVRAPNRAGIHIVSSSESTIYVKTVVSNESTSRLPVAVVGVGSKHGLLTLFTTNSPALFTRHFDILRRIRITVVAVVI